MAANEAAAAAVTTITDNDLILVTGASGYIACHIVKQLLEKGYRVRGTVRSLKDEKKVEPLKKLVENAKHALELVEADLLKEETWQNAVKDCTYVIHTASPFPAEQPKHENELIKPALNGTLFVLRACVQENSKVKRVVLTSSVAAIAGDSIINDRSYSESDWSDINSTNLTAYPKSKTLAEKAAWDFVKERQQNNLPCFELAVINPGFVLGPILHDTVCTSINLIKKLINKEMPVLPDLSIPVCDVRDVATAHLQAMILPEANGNRHIITSTVESTTIQDWAIILDTEFKPKNYNVPTKLAPNWIIKLYSIFDSSVKLVTKQLGVKTKYDNSRLTNVLKIQPKVLKSTLIDMIYSMIDRKIIPKKY